MKPTTINVAAEVIMRLGLEDDIADLVMSYTQEIQWRILNYCQIAVVPEGLYYTWVSMVIDVLRVEQAANDAIGVTIDTGGDNVKVGDTSASGGAAKTKTMSKSVIDSVVVNYHADLNRYRKMRW